MSATLRPDAVYFLRTIVERHCNDHSIRSAEGRASVAFSVFRIYESGITDRFAILRTLEREDHPGR